MEHFKPEAQAVDQTEEKRFLISSKINAQIILQNTTDSIWAIDTSYKLLYANEAFIVQFYDGFGVSPKPDMNIFYGSPESIVKVWKKHYKRVLSNESFSFTNEIRLENKTIYIEVFTNPIVENGTVIGAWFIGKDFSQRKQTEIALENSQLLLKASLESQNETVLFSINKDYEYLYFNKSHSKVMKFAYGTDIKVGMNILKCITSLEDMVIAKEWYDRALKGESHSHIRMFGDKNIAYYESFFNPIINDKNEIIGATALARDITKRKRAELALIESTKNLKELNTTKDKLFSIIAHDLRSPFHSIIGFSDLMIKNLNNTDTENIEKYLNVINSSAKNTLILLDNLLNWAKSQTNQLRFNPEKINFLKAVMDTIILKTSQAKAKNISLNYLSCDKIEVYADVVMLNIILRNLISNAIKFTNSGGQVGISAITKNKLVEISISDTGIGMNDKTLKELYHISSNKTTVGTANEHGSGLGLVLCKEFVEKHKGKIWVESEVGKGSIFKFTLPLKK